MSNEEVLQHYERLVEIHGKDLPNPDHEPMRFQHFVKMYKYYNLQNKSEQPLT